jgi:hypothetical protein
MTPLSITVIEESLAAGPYAFPGGYPKYFVMADGEALSHSAAKDCLEDIHSAHRGAAKRPDQPNSRTVPQRIVWKTFTRRIGGPRNGRISRIPGTASGS